jgi:hypothetical protein
MVPSQLLETMQMDAVTLTRDEYLAIAVLAASSTGCSLVRDAVQAIADRLDPQIKAEQRGLWEVIGCPDFDLSGSTQSEIPEHYN